MRDHLTTFFYCVAECLGFRPSQNRDPKNDFVLEGSKAQRGRLDGEIPPYFARLERGHLPVICLGKTRRNMGINNILIPIFGLAFYRETKWPNVVSEIDFGSRFRTHFGARRNVWAFENVKTLPKQGPEQELVPAVIFFGLFGPKRP